MTAPLGSILNIEEVRAGRPGGRIPNAGRSSWPAMLAGWLLGRRGRDGEKQKAGPPQPRFRLICISRESGAGGGTIGRLIGQKLGWRVYDREILDTISHRMQLASEEVRAFDELAPSPAQDYFLPLWEEYYAPQEAYLSHLDKLLEAIHRAGDSVIVGRGAGFVMPRSEILSVRIIAPVKFRAARLAERMGVSVRTARRAARDLDRRRDRFARHISRLNPADPHNYDLVLDSQSLGFPIVAEVIVRAVEAGRPPASRKAESSPLALEAPGTVETVLEAGPDSARVLPSPPDEPGGP